MKLLILYLKDNACGYPEAAAWLTPIADKLTENRLSWFWMPGNKLCLGRFSRQDMLVAAGRFLLLQDDVAVLESIDTD